ncbi:hypothetical protein B566_EDAN004633 [Ephemera danica]|nr:hypothetical protein B566_EDAN004633 [Ephemera danica]
MDFHRSLQETLAKVRAETRKRQAEAQDARTRREQQLRARLRAAANRKRERQGLPPLPDSDDERAPGDSDEEAELERILLGSRAAQREPEPEPEPLTREERPAPAEPRAWDLEKERPVMSQHEWNEKQRAERKTEFAPPSTSLYGFHSGGRFQLEARRKPSPEPVKKPDKDQPLTISRKTKRRVSSSSSSSDEEIIGPLPPTIVKPNISVPPPNFSVPPPGYAAPSPSFIPLPSTSTQKPKRTWSDVPPPDSQKAKKSWSDTPVPEVKNPKRTWSDEFNETATSSRGKGVEIAPPPTMEYNIGAPRSSQGSRPGIANQKQVESSITAGLAYLRKQAEDREKQRPKGRFDVI